MSRVVFMGSPDFAVPILREVARHHTVAGVVTQPDRGAGRGRELKAPAVKIAAMDLRLEVMQPVKLRAPEAMEQLRSWAPEVIIVAAFGQILRSEVLSLPEHGCVNVHASLLPRWRGAAPIQAAIAAGDAETGVTIMKMDEGVDTGAILAQRSTAIPADDTADSLTRRLAPLGAALLVETLPGYLAGRARAQPQDASQATRAPMLKSADGLLNFAEPAAVLERRIRAFQPWPGTFLMWNEARLGVHRAHVEPGEAAPGRRLVIHDEAAIGTAEGLLVLDEVQVAGKKPLGSTAFLLGARGWAE